MIFIRDLIYKLSLKMVKDNRKCLKNLFDDMQRFQLVHHVENARVICIYAIGIPRKYMLQEGDSMVYHEKVFHDYFKPCHKKNTVVSIIKATFSHNTMGRLGRIHKQ